MIICIVGKKTTNNRIGRFINGLFEAEEFEIIWDGRDNINQTTRIKRVLKVFADLINVFKADVVYFSPFSFGHPIIMRFAKLCNKYIIFEFYVSYYDMAINDNKTYSPESREAKKYLKLDKTALRYSDIVIFLNNSERNYYLKCVEEQDTFDARKSRIIPLVVNSYLADESVNKKEKNDVIHVFYMGNYIPLHGVKKILYACEILSKKGINYQLTMWGTPQADTKPYRNLVEELGIESYVIFRTDWKGQEYYHQEIRKQDIVLGAFGDSGKAKTVVINKVLDAVAEKVPVLTAPSTGLLEFFNGDDDIWFCDNTPNAIAERMIDIINEDEDKMRQRTDNAFMVFQNNFSIHAFNEKIKSLVSEVREKVEE